MLDSSPISSWEGAGAIFNYAGSSGPVFWFVVALVLCIAPLWLSFRAEVAAEKEHG